MDIYNLHTYIKQIKQYTFFWLTKKTKQLIRGMNLETTTFCFISLIEKHRKMTNVHARMPVLIDIDIDECLEADIIIKRL